MLKNYCCKRIPQYLLLLFLSNLAVNSLPAQYHCQEAADTRLPWRERTETRSGARAMHMKPILTEMKRLYPQPPGGLQLTYGIYDAMGGVKRFQGGNEFYESFFMIKDIVCERWNNTRKIVPEGETGCWIYFRANDFRNLMGNHLTATSMYLAGTEFPLFCGKMKMTENANGITSVYVYSDNDEEKMAGWYFSGRKELPYRAISKKELALAYREYWEKKLNDIIRVQEINIRASARNYAEVSADAQGMSEKDRKAYLESLLQSDKESRRIIESCRAQIADCRQRTGAMAAAPDADEPARVSMINDLIYEPDRMVAPPGGGRMVYVENEAIFNKSMPKTAPQFIVASLRRQDITPAKTAFINRVEAEFDWNIVRKMVDMPRLAQPVTIAGMGNTPGGYTSGALPGGAQPAASNGVYFTDDFADAAPGVPPRKWIVSNNTALIKQPAGASGKWLAMSKEGLFFPDYAVLQLPQNFTLAFDLRWNADISYYSPEFLFHIGAARYDNTLKRYDREQVNVNAYTSAYMERICVWIDPYWNDSGLYGWQVFDNRGGFLVKEKAKAGQFYRDRNQVHVKLVREQAKLTIYFNNEKMQELPDAMKAGIRWNFFGCGLSNAPNADAGDEFYISNISLTQ